MDTHMVAEQDTTLKRKLADGIFDFNHDDDFQSCKYLKLAAEKPRPVEVYDLPGSERHCRRLLAQHDALNFQKSRTPLCFLYYSKGEWRDYPQDVTPTIVEKFVARERYIKVTIRTCLYLVNFVRMIQLNLSTGHARSIAWIDKAGQRFFPSKCVEGSCARSLSFIQKSIDQQNQLSFGDSEGEAKWGNTCSFSPLCPDSKVAGTSEKNCNGFGKLGDKLIRVAEGNQDFIFAKDKFLSGFSLFAKDVTITEIYKNCHSSISGQARLQAFKIQQEITAETRGDANVKYAWHGTSKGGVSDIILHGFGQPSILKNGVAYGVGVYFTPEDSSHVSALYSKVDENDEQHMMLCEVIMGRMEQVRAGSQQFHPSNEDYDTGVDNITSPKRYIIWSTQMNTHILPLFIISFKLGPLVRDVMVAAQRGKQAFKECLTRSSTFDDRPFTDVRVPANSNAMCPFPAAGGELQDTAECASSDMQSEACSISGVSPTMFGSKPTKPCNLTLNVRSKGRCRVVPRSPWISFAELFPLLKAKLEPQAIIALQQLHVDFQVGKLPRNLFVKTVRGILGDEFLRDCIKSRPVQAVSGCSSLSFCG